MRPMRRSDDGDDAVVKIDGLAIAELARGPTPNPEQIDDFVESHAFPIVEGRYCTFVFRGDVHAVSLRHWIRGLPTAVPFHRVHGTDVWYHVLELPEKSRIEYKFEVTVGGDTRWIQDPLNPHVARDPYGANSVCHSAGHERPTWVLEDPDTPRGSIEERVIYSKALKGQRRVSIYRPARFRETRRYPLLIVHDGRDFQRYADITTVLDNLIHRLDIGGMVVALTDPVERTDQYRDNPAHAEYIAEELVPTLEEHVPLLGTPAGRGLMGASLGAVASLSTAIRYPDMFGQLLLQSGSFAFSDIGSHDRGPLFDPIAQMVNRYRDDPTRVADRVFVSCGQYESLIYENRSLVPVLQSTGMDVHYVEARDGHNWENWRDRLREGLAFLFPGPLWWVYR